MATGGNCRIELAWVQTPSCLDIACFVVNEANKVLTDDWFVFYNQPSSPGEVVNFSVSSGYSDPVFHLFGCLGPLLSKSVCLRLRWKGAGTFKGVQGLSIQAHSATGQGICFPVESSGDEKALIIGEIYRHSSGWKFRAVAQGFNGGLKPLAEHHGVVIADDDEPEPLSTPTAPPMPVVPPPPPRSSAVPPPPPSAGPAPTVNLNKIDLVEKKGGGVPGEETAGRIQRQKYALFWMLQAQWPICIKNGTVQRCFERVLAVGSVLGCGWRAGCLDFRQ